MTSFRELRPRNRPAKAGGLCIGLIAVLLAGAWLFVAGPQSGADKRHAASAPFLMQALGTTRSEAELVRRPKPGVAVTVEPKRTVVRRDGHALSLAAVGAGEAAWQGFEHGASRPTPFGRETVTVGPERTEEFLTVDRRVGVRTWRWHLGATTLEPKLRHDGSVELRAGERLVGLRIAPATILDAAGKDITPAGTRWSLDRAGGSWNLTLSLNDAELTIPYVIDPAADYPTPLYLSSTAGSVTGSQKLMTTAPSGANAATSTDPGRNTTGYVQFNPGVANTTLAAPAVNGKGWLADFAPSNGGTGFPTGTWNITVTTDVVGAATAGTAVLTVGIWKGTIAGGAFTSTGTVLTPTDDPAAVNIVAGTTPITTTVAVSVPKFSLASGETLLIEIFRHQTVKSTDNTAANRQTAMTVNDGVSLVTHPAADDVVPTHSMSLTPAAGGSWLNTATKTAYYKGNALGSFTLSDGLSDAGSGPYSVTYPAIGTAGWTHAGPDTSTTSPNFTSTTYSWTASPTNPAAQTINGVDNALNPAVVYNLNFLSDITAPANPTGLALLGGPYYTTASVGMSPTDGADGGSGVDTATRVFERDEVNLAGDTCPAFGGAWAAVTLTAGADTTVVNGKCYRYRYKVSDRVGNQTAGYSPISGTAKVDLTKPVDPTFAFSALTAAYSNGTDSVWYKPTAASGAFTVTANSSDPETTVSSYTFPAAAGGWTRSLAGASATYSHTGAPADPAEPNNVTATNNASNASNPASFTVTPDPNAPTGMSASIAGGYYTSTSIHVTLANGSDGAGESGVDATSGVVERDQANLANGICAGFPGTWSTVTLDGSGHDTAVLSGKCYVYRYKISDRVGNQGTQAGTSSTAKVDTSGPDAPTFVFSGFTNAWDNGSGTVYFKGNAAGGFTVTPTATDTESGVASYAYPALGGTWSNTSGAYTFNSSSPDPTEPNNVHGVNGAGTNGTDSSFTVTEDSNAPTGLSASIAAGYYTTTSIHVTLANGSDGAGESGVDTTSGIVERDEAPLLAGACDPFPGSWSTVTLDGSGNDTTVQSAKCYVYRYKISDRVGNQGTQAGTSSTAKVDTSGPDAPTFVFSGFTNAWGNGSGTVYFKGNAAGGFTVTPTATDTESAVPSYVYPTLGSGWSAGGAYTFNSSAVDPAEPNNVHGVNGAGTNGTDASFTVTKDSNAPTGMSATVTAGYVTSTSVTVALANGSDTGSGIDASTGMVERDETPLVGGACDPFPGSWSTVTLSGGDDTTVQSAKCYRYRYSISDRVGNQGTSGASATVKVDASAPSAPSLSFSALTNAYDNGSDTVFYRAGAAGGFTVAAASNDPESGVASTTFPALAPGWSHTAGAYSFTAAAADPGEPSDVFTTNGAGTDSLHQSFTVTPDGNAPTGMSASVTGGYATSASVAVALANGFDGAGESGLDASSGIVERDETPLAGGACDPFPGSWSTVTLSGGDDTTVQSAKCYRYRYSISDRVGNQGTSGASATVKVDTTPPTAPSLSYSGFTRAWENGSGTVYFKGGAAGGFTVTGTATDPESGVASYVYPALGSGWSNLGDYGFGSAADPAEPNNVHAINGAGEAGGDTSFTVTLDASAPTGMSASVSGGYATSTTIPVTLANGSDTGSGLEASSGIAERDEAPLSGGSCEPFPGSWATVTLSGGNDMTVQSGKCYRYRYSISDRVGNQGVSAASATVKVDTSQPSAPGLTFSALTNAFDNGSGTLFYRGGGAGGFTVSAASTDAESGIASTSFPAFGSGWSNSAGAYSFASVATDPSEPNNVHTTNGAGLDSNDASFTVTADSVAPTTTAQCDGTACSLDWYGTTPVAVTLASSDGTGSGLAAIRYTTDGSDPTVFSTAYTISLSVASTTTVKFRAWDNVGNVESVRTLDVKIDTSPPSAPALTLSESSPSSYVSGTTLYYNPSGSNSGSFTVDAITADAESAIEKVTFAALTGIAGGGDDLSSPFGNTYDWTAASSASGSQTVTALNNAGLTASSTFTVTPDTAAPTGMSASVAGGYSASTTIPVSLDDGTDGGAGLDSPSGLVERDEAALTGGACDPFPGSWATVTLSSGNDTAPTGKCYRYRYSISDRVGNQGVSAASATVKVDATGPSAPSLVFSALTAAYDNGSGTVFYRPSAAAGSLTVTASSTDAQSGVSGYSFPAASSGWTQSLAGASATYSHTGSPTEPGSGQNVHATNAAGIDSGDTAFALTADSSAPTGMSATTAGGYSTSVHVTLASGADAGSGVDGSSGIVERDEAPLSDDACSAFPGSWTTVTLDGTGEDATVQSGKCYRYRYSISDRVGNQGVSAASATAKVDTDAPSAPTLSFGSFNQATAAGSTVFYRPGPSGGFTVTASSADGESGVASYAFPNLGAGWTGTGSGSSRAYAYTGTPIEPTGSQDVTARNGAGLDSAPGSFGVVEDGQAPTTLSQCNGAACNSGFYTSSPVSVTFAADDGSGSGVSEVRYTTDGSDPTAFSTAYTAPISVSSTTTIKFRAWDNTGNVESVATRVVQIDSSVPPTPTLTITENSAGSFVSGSTLFYNPTLTNSGSFLVHADAGDPDSGIQKVTFASLEGMTGGGDATSAPYETTYDWTTASTADGSYDVTALNGAGLRSSASLDVAIDSTAAAGGSVTYTNGWNTTGSISVGTAMGSDAGSGIDASTAVLERDSTSLTDGFCGSFGATWTAVSSPDVVTDGCYHYRFRVADHVGNERIYTSAQTVKVDTSAPSAPTLGFSGFTNASAGGSTVWFRGGAAGGFTVTPSSTDAQSGIDSYAYPALGSGWSRSGGDYSFTGSAAEPGSGQNVHAVNGAGTSSTDTAFTVSVDSAAPATTIACDGGSCAGWATASPVSVTLNASDGESGIDHVVYTTDGSDPTSGGTTYSGAFTVSATATVKYAAYDRVGNVELVQSKTIQIDTTAPSTPALSFSALTNASASGGTVYFRPGVSGGFNVSASSSDGESGVSSYSFPALGAGWSASGAGATSAYSFTNAAADPAEPNEVTATNNAGQTSTPASLTVTADSSPPSGGGVDYMDGFRSSASVALTLNDGTDAGAGLDTTAEVLERSVATFSNGTCVGFGSFTTLAVDPSLAYTDLTVATGNCYMYRYVVQDRVGNVQTYTSSAVAKFDLEDPAATQGDPGPYLRGTVTLTGTATDTGGSDVAGLAFEYSDDSGTTWKPISTDSTSPYSAGFDTTTAATPDGVYDLRTVATDGAGNSSPSPVVAARRIDNTPPSASISSPAANVRGVVNLDATVSDSGSGISTTAYQFSSDGGATWTSTPASWNTALTSDGIYAVRVVATDNAGNQAADTSGSFRVDNTPPVAVLDDPGAYLRETVNLTSTASDSGSGLATVTYERSPAGANSWTSIPAAWDTVPVTDGLYDLRVVAVDNAGNRTDSAVQTSRVDNLKPDVSLDSPTSNSDVAGTVTLTSTASDAGSGLAGPVTYEYRTHAAPAGPWTATPSTWDTTLLADGGYDVRATAVDRAGNSRQSNVADDVRVDNTPPTIALTAPAEGGYVNAASADPYSLAATANDTGSGVKQVEFFQCSDTSAGCATGTWSSVGIHAAPGPYSADWAIPADGHRALRVVATDNADRTASSFGDVTVDRTLPDTTIVTKPGDPSNEASPTFTFSSTEPGSTFECSLDGGSFAPCSSGDALGSLTDGTHDFAVEAIDPAGNTDTSPATWTWLTDLTPPTATMDNPGVNVRGVVLLTSTQDDPGGANASGVATVSYEYSADAGTSWAPTPASWDTAPITDGIYQLRVIVVDNAGNQTIDTLAADVRVDNTAPSSSQDDPGQYLRQTISLTGSAADPDDPAGRPGSGVTQVRFEVSPAGADTWTTVGTAASAPYSASLDTATLADGHYDFRTVATDAAGNEAPGGTVANRLVDNTAPTASMGDPGANLRGTVTLASTTDDPGTDASGVSSVDYEVSSGGGWTPVPDNWSTSSMPDGLYDLRVTATDRAGNATTSSTVGGRRVDNTPPSTSDDAPSGYSSSDVTVNLSASDSGSGVSVTEYSVDGGGFQAGSSVTIPAPSNGSNDGTHTISYFSADVAGNIEPTKATTVDIDATPPVCSSCSANDYLRGTETLSANPAASLSGIKSVTFEYADAGAPRTSPPPGTWHTIGFDTSAPYRVDWNTSGVSDGAYDLRILVKNNANNTSVTYLDSKVVDNTAPTAGVGSPVAGALVSGSVTFAATTADANPIASVEFFVGGSSLATVGSAPFRTSWDTTGESDGSASLHVVVTDIAGNSTTSGSRTVTIDNNGPQPSLGDPGAGISGSVTLTASSDSDTVRVDIQRSRAGLNMWTTIGSPTSAPFSATFDSTDVVDGSYDLRAVATDQSGHVGTSPIVTTSVDNTAPTASLTRPTAGATIGGPTASLTAAASDPTSGVASVLFQYRPTGGGGFTDIADDTSSPYAVSWDAATVATGSYDLRVVATDAAGNVAMSAPVTVNVDSTAPLVVLDDPGAKLSGAVTLTATTSGSPAARVTFERSPAGASNWTAIATDSAAPWSASFDTTSLADGLYDLRAVAADALGNERASVRSGIRIDNGVPTLVSSNPADGAVIASANAIVVVASETLAAIDGATLDGASLVAPILSGSQATYPVGAIGPGPHTLTGILRDESGKTRAFRVHFTIWTSGDGTTPYVEENSPRDASTTVTAPGDGASVTMPQGAWPANANDWIVVRIEMNPAPSGLAGPLTFESGVADVTAHWALSGAELHIFDQPLTITIASAANNVAGATFNGSTWRVLRRVPTPGTLPAGWSDGYWSDGSGVHILTLHLSQFAAVRDLTPPAADSGSGGGSDSGDGSDSGTTTTTPTTPSTTTTTTTTPNPQARLSMRVAAAKVFRPGRQVRIGARIISTKKAMGTVTLRNADGSQLATWAFKVKTGSNVLLFKMPASVRKPGRYTLSWGLVAEGDSAAKVTKLTIPGTVAESTLGGAAPARPDVVLAAPGFSVRSLALPRTVRVLKTSDAADAFDLTAADATNVRVVVFDVDRLGLNYLHDLHTIFPSVRIVALANDPGLRRRALVAGAAVALPHAAGPARVSAAVRRLARR